MHEKLQEAFKSWSTKGGALISWILNVNTLDMNKFLEVWRIVSYLRGWIKQLSCNIHSEDKGEQIEQVSITMWG